MSDEDKENWQASPKEKKSLKDRLVSIGEKLRGKKATTQIEMDLFEAYKIGQSEGSVDSPGEGDQNYFHPDSARPTPESVGAVGDLIVGEKPEDSDWDFVFEYAKCGIYHNHTNPDEKLKRLGKVKSVLASLNNDKPDFMALSSFAFAVIDENGNEVGKTQPHALRRGSVYGMEKVWNDYVIPARKHIEDLTNELAVRESERDHWCKIAKGFLKDLNQSKLRIAELEAENDKLKELIKVL
jgi:hypothetical protein